jgi:SAM-dependent methyltransferase
MANENSLELPVTQIQEFIAGYKDRFGLIPYILGRCNICGYHTAFFCSDKALYRESLVCAHCLTTSRYRSIARGILRAINDLAGIDAPNLASLKDQVWSKTLRVFDTQVPFYGQTGAYPIPDLLARCERLDINTSIYKPGEPGGKSFGPNTTNQNLEALTFPDDTFDLVITSDVMEHVRLDDRAHCEIRRVLKPGGIYLFTVPHFRHVRETFYRVAVQDPDDTSKDVYLTEKEYHGDANSEEGRALSYRSYGTEIDEKLQSLGFTVEYTKEEFPDVCILNTELFYCRLVR